MCLVFLIVFSICVAGAILGYLVSTTERSEVVCEIFGNENGKDFTDGLVHTSSRWYRILIRTIPPTLLKDVGTKRRGEAEADTRNYKDTTVHNTVTGSPSTTVLRLQVTGKS